MILNKFKVKKFISLNNNINIKNNFVVNYGLRLPNLLYILQNFTNSNPN